MENVNYITEMFGVVEPDVLFEYIHENWKTIDYNTTIHILLQKFEESVKKQRKHSASTKKYQDIRITWEHFNSKDRGEVVCGHFVNCTGGGWCKCNYTRFDFPRDLIGTIIHAYYPVQCITKMVRKYSFGYVIQNFEKNWRRMDLQKIMKWILRVISKDVGGDTYEYFKKRHTECFSDLKNREVSHVRYGCIEVFHDGMLECACFYNEMYEKPKSFIRDMLERYYRLTGRK